MIFGALRPPLEHVYATVAAVLEKSVARDPLESLQEVMDGIESGYLTAWVATDGADLHSVTVTQIVSGMKGKQCFIRHCARADEGAPLAEWLEYLPIIEYWAASEGCASIELIGRMGWLKVLPDYERQAVQMRKMLVRA